MRLGEMCKMENKASLVRVMAKRFEKINKKREKRGKQALTLAEFAEESNNNTGMGNIVEDVQDMFDEMGNMEGVQLYDNVEGGIGHVTASTSQCYRYVP